MRTILSNQTASISELKKSPAQLLKNAGEQTIAILNRNVPSAVYEKMIEIIDDYYLSKEVSKALQSKEKPVRVNLDDL